MEVYYQGVWGTVCDDSWDDNDARVVCRQLGLQVDNATSVTNGYFGQGWGQHRFSEVLCIGRESCLLSCPFTHGWTNKDCSSSQANAGVQCGKFVMGLSAPGRTYFLIFD